MEERLVKEGGVIILEVVLESCSVMDNRILVKVVHLLRLVLEEMLHLVVLDGVLEMYLVISIIGLHLHQFFKFFFYFLYVLCRSFIAFFFIYFFTFFSFICPMNINIE